MRKTNRRTEERRTEAFETTAIAYLSCHTNLHPPASNASTKSPIHFNCCCLRISMPLDDPDFLLAQEKFRFGRGELKWQKAKNYLDHFLLLFISSLQSCAACYLTFSGLTPPVCLPIFLYLSKRDRYNSPPPSH